MSATNRGAVRAPLDFYETPEWVTVAILDHLTHEVPLTPLHVLDVGCGTGAVGAVIAERWEPTRLTGWELDTMRAARARPIYDEVHVGDFLACDLEGSADLVIGNPPFSHALEFIERSFAASLDGTVAMLLRLAFLASKKRRDWWQRHPADVYVLSQRPSFTGKGTDRTEYAWFVWGPGPRGRVRVL